MVLPDDDRRALLARLAPGGDAAAEVLVNAFDEGEELREIVVDAQGDVVAFTDRRALYVAEGADNAVAVGYDEVEVRKRAAGLSIDALIEGGRLILEVARATFVRLAVVGAGAPPGRATWLPNRTPTIATPTPAPAATPATTPPPIPAASTAPPAPPGESIVHRDPAPPSQAPAAAPSVPYGVTAPVERTGPKPPPAVRPPMPTAPPPGVPPAGWHPDPSGRHWWRWWDGMGWTDHVADGGPPFTDALPPR